MSHDDSDDGLMHARVWEAEPTPWREEQLAEPDGHAVADDGYDDGLVHDHGWACSERGRMAHR
ncbi:hypothetical protein [Belnapia rosea]|uniref:hypothetical protein n=1 Tax=Belnapia rosea TaxID=938405 RepID=UPI0008825677|nr:hypothetical protein [Belnapia rosea]SDB38519.1 hypothetical protein SAMN02927895_01460 [Belnapia rosea]